MTTNATIGYNKLAVQAYGGSPIAYVNIEEVRSVSGLGVQGNPVEVTNFDTTAGDKEFIPGLKEGSEVTVSCNWRPNGTVQNNLITSANSGQNRNFKLTNTAFSPNKSISFAAAVLGYTYGPSATDPNSIEFRLKISGALT